MTDDERSTEMLRTSMNAIHNQTDAGLLPAFQAAIDQVADEVLARDVDAVWHRAPTFMQVRHGT